MLMVVPIVKTKLDQFSEKPKSSRESQRATYFLPLLQRKYAGTNWSRWKIYFLFFREKEIDFPDEGIEENHYL